MGRGLSDLQKKILLLAREKSASRTRAQRYSAHSVDLYVFEIAAEIFGLPLEPVSRGHQGKGHCIGGQNFRLETIGKQKYHSVKASISRAVVRLEKRRLVSKGDYGIRITDAGIKAASSFEKDFDFEAEFRKAEQEYKRRVLPANQHGGDKWWDVLSVTPFDSWEDIKLAYRQWAFKFHPDTSGLDREDANDRMKALNWAYEEAKLAQGLM